ncbi:integrase, catalytic region, zinc finger, CCHC-type containing protein [Tanacetum coccineum]|uniref:Integrase, catalytic region, zinc finger, CCHC-type containing protein n=1 Tax=Tanacetum coccineum TaxID=301880 RepID=A0ABQ5DSQ4_9ASTR
MQGTDISRQERNSRLMNEFDKFMAEDGESLASVYERFSTLINVIDRNKVTPKEISIKTKFLISLQLEWSKYVTLAPITQHYLTPTNNRLRASSNTRNQDVIQDGHLDIQIKNVGYTGNGNKNAGITNRNQATNAGNGLCYSCNGKGYYVRDCLKPRVHDAKYFREQMLLATKDEAGVHLDEEENDFVLNNAYGNNTLEELSVALISEVNASQIDMINGLLSKSDHEHSYHKKLETIIHTFANDQIDFDIIFDDPYMDNNSRQAEHDTNAHDQSFFDFESLINNV